MSNGKRRALLIGNGNYEDEGIMQLQAPYTDVEGMKRVLSNDRIGQFEVDTHCDGECPALGLKVSEFFSNGHSEDVLLFYFSGHGIKDDEGVLYLACQNTIRDQPQLTALQTSWIKDWVKKSRAKNLIIILDCCYSGAFGEKSLPQQNEVKEDVKRIYYGDDKNQEENLPEETVILSACRASQKAYEGDAPKVKCDENIEGSIFTHFLIKKLEAIEDTESGIIYAHELHAYAQKKVRECVGGQEPQATIARYTSNSIWIARDHQNTTMKRTLKRIRNEGLLKIDDISVALKNIDWNKLDTEELQDLLNIDNEISKLLQKEYTPDQYHICEYIRKFVIKQPLELLADNAREEKNFHQASDLYERLYKYTDEERFNDALSEVENLLKTKENYETAKNHYDSHRYDDAIPLFFKVLERSWEYEEAAYLLYRSVEAVKNLKNSKADEKKFEEVLPSQLLLDETTEDSEQTLRGANNYQISLVYLLPIPIFFSFLVGGIIGFYIMLFQNIIWLQMISILAFLILLLYFIYYIWMHRTKIKDLW